VEEQIFPKNHYIIIMQLFTVDKNKEEVWIPLISEVYVRIFLEFNESFINIMIVFDFHVTIEYYIFVILCLEIQNFSLSYFQISYENSILCFVSYRKC